MPQVGPGRRSHPLEGLDAEEAEAGLKEGGGAGAKGEAAGPDGRVVDLIGIVSASGFSKVSLKSSKLEAGAGGEAGIVPVP